MLLKTLKYEKKKFVNIKAVRSMSAYNSAKATSTIRSSCKTIQFFMYLKELGSSTILIPQSLSLKISLKPLLCFV